MKNTPNNLNKDKTEGVLISVLPYKRGYGEKIKYMALR